MENNQTIIIELTNLINETGLVLNTLSDEMESLDENSKDFIDLDFEYNYASGMLHGYNRVLELIKNN